MRLPPADVTREHAYLVARGVRPIALLGQSLVEDADVPMVTAHVEVHSVGGAIPFVLDSGVGVIHFGYAAAPWVLDLYRWILSADGIPQIQRDRIMGLLCGYSVEAIREFEEANGLAGSDDNDFTATSRGSEPT
jgi:hypothetical protein